MSANGPVANGVLVDHDERREADLRAEPFRRMTATAAKRRSRPSKVQAVFLTVTSRRSSSRNGLIVNCATPGGQVHDAKRQRSDNWSP